MSKARIKYWTVEEIEIDLSKAKEYLITKGWVEGEKFGPYLIIFRRKNSDIEDLVKLPISDEPVDFNRVVTDFLYDLSIAEGRCEMDILREITNKEPEGLRKISHEGNRMETGPVQFGEDWPGIFIRGDNALADAMQLEIALHYVTEDVDSFALSGVRQLIKLLRSCNVQRT